MRKNADPYQFQTLVEQLSGELFSLPDTIERVKIIISEETGVRPSTQEVTKALTRIYTKNDFGESVVSKAFNLQNAASLATIIQLFLTGSK